MPDLTRRKALQFGTGALVCALAGCSQTVGLDADSASTTPTRTTRRTPQTVSPPYPTVQDPPVALTASMLQQPSAEEPARFEVRLRNVGSKTVTLGMGPTLLFSDNAATDDLQWADAIVIDPETYIGPWEDPFRTDDACWRYPNDGRMLVQSILEEIEVVPGDSITETYEVYTRGKTQPCLPKGRYYFQDKNFFSSGALQGTDSMNKEARAMILTVVLQINGEHRITVQAQNPAIEA